jgi:aspartate/methionine/tyrosine aminotransferase
MPQRHFRRNVQNLPPNPGADVLRYGWEKENVISLAQGEGCAATPDFIINAANEAMKAGKTHYGPVLGQPLLREEISDYYKRIFNVDLPPNRAFVTGSGTTAMHLALTGILETDDEVVAITPIWKNLLGATELAQAKTIQVPLDYDDKKGWSLDMDRLLGAVTDKTKAILVVTPSNPTGWCMSHQEMKTLLDYARQRDIWIVSDEVYNRSAYGLNHAPSFLEVAEPDDLLMTVNSFSKNWAMTGWRLGWLTGPEFAENFIRDIALYDNMGAPTFTQFGAIEALKNGENFIAEQVALWETNIDLLMDWFSQKPNTYISRPESTFYGFFKVDGEEDSLGFAMKLIDEAGLSLAPGCAFGKNCDNWMRLCFAVSQEKLNEALGRLEKVIG